MPLTFTPAELPNPILLTDAKNLEYMRAKEAEHEAKQANAAARKTAAKPSKKRKAANEEENDASSSKKKSKKTRTAGDLFQVHLPGDEDASVAIYDSCDEVRRKINAHLRGSGITKTSFLRDMSRAAYTDAPNIQSKQLTDFLSKKGPTSGNTSRVFYAAYVYFEKKRIGDGKPKNKHRLEMEERWGREGGISTTRDWDTRYLCTTNRMVVQDKLGTVRSVPAY